MKKYMMIPVLIISGCINYPIDCAFYVEGLCIYFPNQKVIQVAAEASEGLYGCHVVYSILGHELLHFVFERHLNIPNEMDWLHLAPGIFYESRDFSLEEKLSEYVIKTCDN